MLLVRSCQLTFTMVARYRKLVLYLTILGSASLFIILYQSRDRSDAIIIYDGTVKNILNPSFRHTSDTLAVYDGAIKNASAYRLNPKTGQMTLVGFLKVASDATRRVMVDTRPVASFARDASGNTSGPESYMPKQLSTMGRDVVTAAPKKTIYPITLYTHYLIENPALCSSVQNLSIVVIVHTAPVHFQRRNTIRATWANETYFKHLGRVRVLFLLGKVKDDTLQKEIEVEFSHHRDLLQGDFIDAYRNLTLKGAMAYKWLSERCRNAKLVLKVDDDVVVNMYDILTKLLPKYENKSKQIHCNHILPGTMLIIRRNNSKWYVNENQFRGKKFYPRYCSGFTVIFTNDVIPALYRAATVTPFFWVDDVYLYGLVPAKVPGIKYNGFKQGDHQLTGRHAIECYKNTTKTCKFLVTGAGDRPTADTIWTFMTKAYEARTLQISADNLNGLQKMSQVNPRSASP